MKKSLLAAAVLTVLMALAAGHLLLRVAELNMENTALQGQLLDLKQQAGVIFAVQNQAIAAQAAEIKKLSRKADPL